MKTINIPDGYEVVQLQINKNNKREINHGEVWGYCITCLPEQMIVSPVIRTDSGGVYSPRMREEFKQMPDLQSVLDVIAKLPEGVMR